MTFSDMIAGIGDIFNPTEIRTDITHMAGGVLDLIESLWNEEGVLKRNEEPPLNRVPTADELSYRN